MCMRDENFVLIPNLESEFIYLLNHNTILDSFWTHVTHYAKFILNYFRLF
jgi:hypothetical protein